MAVFTGRRRLCRSVVPAGAGAAAAEEEEVGAGLVKVSSTTIASPALISAACASEEEDAVASAPVTVGCTTSCVEELTKLCRSISSSSLCFSADWMSRSSLALRLSNC